MILNVSICIPTEISGKKKEYIHRLKNVNCWLFLTCVVQDKDSALSGNTSAIWRAYCIDDLTKSGFKVTTP